MRTARPLVARINEGVTREEKIRDCIETADSFVLSGDNEAVKVI